MSAPNNFENVLQYIHSNYIKQNAVETARNNTILGNVVEQILSEMNKDAFFGQHFNRIFYGGSYYDGMKVGKPEEYDLYVVLKVSKRGNPRLVDADEQGYLQMLFHEPDMMSASFQNKFLVDTYYVSALKVQAWMKSVFSKALNKFGSQRNGYTFVSEGNYLQGSQSENIPAMILRLNNSEISIKIHFVPCFEFTNDQWPSASYDRESLFRNRKTFFIVPKSPLATNAYPYGRYWRSSFQEQERELLHDERSLKPTLKLLKRLRDVEGHREVTSYCIKTIFLWEHMANGDSYWNGPMTKVFFKMLDKYIIYIQSGNIRHFWNPEHNLLNISTARKENVVNRLRKIQMDLLRKYETEPTVICQYLRYSAPLIASPAGCFTSTYSAPRRDYSAPVIASPTNYSAPRRDTSTSTTTATSSGLSGFSKLAIGLGVGLAAIAGVAALTSSNSNRNDDDSD